MRKSVSSAIVVLLLSHPAPAFAQVAADHAVLADPDGSPIVIGSTHRIKSSVYGDEQIVTVRLPRDYAKYPDRRYPILFSIDGGPDQDFELLAGVAAEAEFSASIAPFILVGVKTNNRYSQLSPSWTRLPRKRLDDAFGGSITPGGADKFRDYLERDVIPWATGRYRSGRKIVTAASLGGLFVVDTFIERPALFDDYIALTPSVWWDGGRIVDEARAKLARHPASRRRLYVTMGDEGVGNKSGPWLDTLIATLKTGAPTGVKWAFVDRSGSEEHRTMALTGWLDAMRTLYLTPSRSGLPLTLIYDDFKLPAYTPQAKANIDAGKCSRAIAKPVTFGQKNAAPFDFYGTCLLMKPGAAITAGNMTAADIGAPAD